MTMQPFSVDELAAMQATQDSAMQDTCVLLAHTPGAADNYGMPEEAFTIRVVIPCGLDPTPSREMLNAQAHQYDAQVRLPIGVTINPVDRVRITHRFGVALAQSVLYEVIGQAQRGPSGLVLNLRGPVINE